MPFTVLNLGCPGIFTEQETESSMILERIYEKAAPRLEGKKIKDARIGLELMAVELSGGEIGVTYLLRKETGEGCMSFPWTGRLSGMDADECARMVLDKQDVISKALGLAVMNAVADVSGYKDESGADGPDAAFSAKIEAADQIGVIGRIGPLINRLKDKRDRMYIFERGENLRRPLCAESTQPELLPECQVVFITRSTVINGTLEKILSYCKEARDVVMVGSSTPLYPEVFMDTPVTVLSGTQWPSSARDDIMAYISQCAGMKQLIRFGRKVSVKTGNQYR